MSQLHLIAIQPALQNLILSESIAQITDGCHAQLFETGQERKVTNIRDIPSVSGTITLDAKDSLVAIDHIACESGAIHVGGIDADGEPILQAKDQHDGIVRVGLIEAKELCSVTVNNGTNEGAVNDINCL